MAAVDSWIPVRGDFIFKEEREGESGGWGGVVEGGREARGEAAGGGVSGKRGTKVGGEERRRPWGNSQGGGGERAR